MGLIFRKPQYFLILLSWSVIGCVNTKKYNEVLLRNGSEYYELKYVPGKQDLFADPIIDDPDTIFFTKKTSVLGNRASLKQKNDQLTIKPSKGKPDKVTFKIIEKTISDSTFNKLINLTASNVFPSPLQKLKISNATKDTLKKYVNSERWGIDRYEPEGTGNASEALTMLSKLPTTGDTDDGIYFSSSFKYIESQTVFQAMTIPFKYRKSLNDTIPAQVTNSFNVGFAVGRKISWKSYRQYYRGDKFLNPATRSISLTPGLFVGPTLIELENGESVKEPIKLDRTSAGITTGAFLVIGVNKFNIGIAFGIDKALGTDNDKWIYQEDPFWWGFVLAFDFIK
ncbi:MAG: hypothetical protein AAF620_06590 [Bacteroidota bacterium]